MRVLRSTVADVDLDAIAANLAAIRRPGEDVIAVVKADAYGHGAEAVSAVLVEAGARMLAVFTVEEGLALRAAGIAAPILVLGGITDPSEASAAVERDLAVTVWDTERARMLADAAVAAGRRATVHVKVDSGLTRLGAPPDEAGARYEAIRSLRGIAIEGVFTHLANADEAVDHTSETQLRRFADVVEALPDRPALVHAAASAGIVAVGRVSICNATRPGLALYGLHPAPHLASLPLRPALRWSSRVHRVRDVPAGTGVGYGHEYRLERAGRIATVPVGYGDGLPRASRPRGRVLLRGERLPFAGRVSMDVVMLDVTDAPGAREGDEVVLIGAQGTASVTAEDLAEACGTITYEIIVNLHPRVPRRYLRGGRLVATKTLLDGFAWC